MQFSSWQEFAVSVLSPLGVKGFAPHLQMFIFPPASGPALPLAFVPSLILEAGSLLWTKTGGPEQKPRMEDSDLKSGLGGA